MTFFDYLSRHAYEVRVRLIEHFQVVLVAMLIATAVGVTLGMLVHRSRRATDLALAICGVFLTIPSFALFALLIPVLGLGYQPTLCALVLYALLPIVRNTVAGLESVDKAIMESARGMGLNGRQRLWRIQVPLAWPVILTGIRVSTVVIVGIAAIAAGIVNGPGLGEFIFGGLAAIGSPFALNQTLVGVIGVALVALTYDAVFVLIGRFTTSRGIRG
ncbi:MAG: ABC transporter permease [Pseudonocardiales bacterium]|nr:MAG: ABC transporter permease [Pseudonocardiales bacterium]